MVSELIPCYYCVSCGLQLTTGFLCYNCGSKNSELIFELREKRRISRLSNKPNPLENQLDLFVN